MAPLTNLLKAKEQFVWSPAYQEAFEQAKKLLGIAPVLAAPRLDRPFKVYTDASHVGAGGRTSARGQPGHR